MKLKQEGAALVKDDNGVQLGFSKGANYEVTILDGVKVSTAQLTEEEMLKLAFWIQKKTVKNDISKLVFDTDHLFDFIGNCNHLGKEVKRLQALLEKDIDRVETLRDLIKEQIQFIHNIHLALFGVCEIYRAGEPLTSDHFMRLGLLSDKAAHHVKKGQAELD